MIHELFAPEELEPGGLRAVSVDGIAVVVVRSPDGKVYALRDNCSHAGAPLSRGTVRRMIAGDKTGEYKLTHRYVLRCPWHGFEFSLEDGRCPADPARERVRAYAVSVVDGKVCLER